MALIDVPRKDLDVSELWVPPDGAATADLTDARSGLAPLLPTRISLWRSDANLFVLFAGEDREMVANYTNHDDPLWEEDVVELFLAPERREEYFELEISPRGTIFDALVISPDLDRRTMRVEASWDCEGLKAAVRVEPGRRLEVLVCVPFAGLGREAPAPGERWSANFYRIDRSAEHGDEYSAWCPTMRTPADFHVPDAFGELRFPSS